MVEQSDAMTRDDKMVAIGGDRVGESTVESVVGEEGGQLLDRGELVDGHRDKLFPLQADPQKSAAHPTETVDGKGNGHLEATEERTAGELSFQEWR